MNKNALSVLAFTAALGFSGAAGAVLTSYTSSGVDLVFDDSYGSDGLTWTADANLFKTQYDADHTVVDQIIAAVPIITHIGTVNYPSPYNITAADFNTSTGLMSWFGAMAWAEWLGSINYGGANDWRLPTTLQPDSSCLDQTGSISDSYRVLITSRLLILIPALGL